MQHKLTAQPQPNGGNSSFFSQKTERASKNNHRVRADLRKTEYPLLFNVATNSLHWKVWSVMKQSKDDRNLIWNDGYVTEKEVRKLNFYQRINHFPGSEELGKKNLLAINLERLKGCFSQDFFPQTWILPRDSSKLKIVLGNQPHQQYYIAKPEALSQGKGIFLFNSIDRLPSDWESSNFVVQKYIHNPFLIDGLKFDFRIYVLLRSLSPLRIYVYKEGLARFATTPYQTPSSTNESNTMMHLTNYAINKRSPSFLFSSLDEDSSKGHKRSMSSVIELLRSMRVNVDSLCNRIDSAIVKTILSCLPRLTETYKRGRDPRETTSVCFQILGFDVMIDQHLNPFVIEVNHSPSFATDSELDYRIKKGVIEDTFKIIRVDSQGKKSFLSDKKSHSTAKIPTDSELKEMEIQEDEFQERNMGGYRRIFPTQSVEINHIHEQIVASKPIKLCRINFQNLNKTKISELQRKNALNRAKQLGFDESGRVKTEQSQSINFFPSLPEMNSAKTNYCYSIEETSESEGMGYKGSGFDLSQKRVRRIGEINQEIRSIREWNERQFLKRKQFLKMESRQKLNKSQELQTLKLKNLEAEFEAPSKKQKYFRGSMIHSSTRTPKEPSKVENYPNKNRIYWTTKSIMMNYEKVKREYSQEQQEENQERTLVELNPHLNSIVIRQANLETEQDTEEDLLESQYKAKARGFCYGPTLSIKRPIRIRERSFIKPSFRKKLGEDKRRFSQDEKRLIVGYF